MNYSYYKVLDKSDNVIFEYISNDADSHQVYYENEYWILSSLLYSYFFDLGFTVCTVNFTIKELNDWLLKRDGSN